MRYDYVTEAGKTVRLDTMMKIILRNHAADGWLAVYFGVPGWPEDIEIPLLSIDSAASIVTVAAHMRNRFPGVLLYYRDRLGHLSHVADFAVRS